MRHTISMAATIAGLALLTGCDAPVEHRAGAAAPVGAQAPGTSAAAPASTSPSTPPTTAAGSPTETNPPTATTSPEPTRGPTTRPTPTRTATALVLGPTSLGRLTIGMTVAQARATDMIVSYRGSAGSCGYSRLRSAPADGGTVTHSPRKGIIAIAAYGAIRTPEGIKLGSSLEQVRDAYADFSANPEDDPTSDGTGRSVAGTRDGDHVHYRITFRNYRVAELELEHDEQDCYE